ncbi:MAG: HEAT repeat domain-containing protein [Caldilineaceae bacterium]|nr:HEAT repeat domain-containing protein [Caldilineaceae bacterium]
MTQPPLLLTDEQMRQFIAHGYLILQTDFPAEFHESMSRQIAEVMTKEGNPGNNILPRVPEVQEVFRHPTIRGALTSVLGPDYIMHPHRHCHFTLPGRKTQSWHKDSYWGHAKVRNHHQWWAMIFYYNHAVDEELGPSGLMPGTQYYNNRTGDETEQDIHMQGQAGTFALIHYDLWHRGGANLSADRTRSMLKFQFVRMARPVGPTWDHTGTGWRALNGDGPPNQHESIWQHQWQWLGGNDTAPRLQSTNGTVGTYIDALTNPDKQQRLRAADRLGLLGDAAGDAIPALAGALADEYEPVALNAAYALAGMGAPAIDALVTALESEQKDVVRNAAYGLAALGSAAVNALTERLNHSAEQTRGYAAFALGEVGLADIADPQPAVAGLAQVVADESEWVRRNGVEALGTLGIKNQPATERAAVEALCNGLRDGDGQVRFTSALSLTRLGPESAVAVPALQQALHDENRYVRANAVDALKRIDTDEAKAVLIDYLLASRWCPSTTPDSTF